MQERGERLANAARKKAQNAKNLEAQSRRLAGEAKRKSEDARRKGLPKHRWENEIQRWSVELQRAANDARRFDDEARRKDRDVSSLSKEIKIKQEALGEKLKSSHAMDQRFQYLARTSGTKTDTAEKPDEQAAATPAGSGASDAPETNTTAAPDIEPGEDGSASTPEASEADGEPPSDGSTPQSQPALADRRLTEGAARAEAVRPRKTDRTSAPTSVASEPSDVLTITTRAMAALQEILRGMGNRPEQLLRLYTGPDGGVVVALDTRRTGDHVVDHDGNAVLLIDRRLPRPLAGKTLDTSETSDGKQLVLL